MSANAPTATCQIGLLLFPEVEVLDAAGPYEVFTTASRMAARNTPIGEPAAPPPFAVHTLAEQAGPVRARAGLVMLAEHALADAPALDLLLVPGGDVRGALASPALLHWLHAQGQAGGPALIASICTGAFLLGAAGLWPPGTTVTTHWEDAADLQAAHPALQVRAERRYIDAGARLSSAGISAGIDMALHLVARLAGLPLAERTARQMDVVWTRDHGE